jgi:predicted DNA-binding transcriptional regulator AlpA
VAYHKRELATIPLPPGQYLLRSDQVIKYLPISIWSFLEGVKCGRYPAAVSISPRLRAWRSEDIRQLLEHGLETADDKIQSNEDKSISGRSSKNLGGNQ